MIKPGDSFPHVTLYESKGYDEASHCPSGPERVDSEALFKGKKVVVFGLPGAFTPTCSGKHVPGYLEAYDALKAKGVDEIVCISVNDGYVMGAWGRDQKVGSKIRMLGDGSGELTKKLGLEQDLSGGGMGTRCRRFSMLVDNGVVKTVNVEEPKKFDVSDAATMLKQV
ncbi:MAG TPA: peroxiredoxin [Labilithrix sp.]|nr:peroxiredoxin [Labilithrix sp.]